MYSPHVSRSFDVLDIERLGGRRTWAAIRCSGCWSWRAPSARRLGRQFRSGLADLEPCLHPGLGGHFFIRFGEGA